MRLTIPFRVGLLLLLSTASTLGRDHSQVSLTRVSADQKQVHDEHASVVYVLAGSGLMSLGLLFGHIRQKPERRRSR